MTHKEKDILSMFSELNSMFNELIRDSNRVLDDNVELKKALAWYKDYADRLVNHKDMVCLPADLKNLRESNTALAIENQELKKQVETLKGVITQAWFTDVEEKDKQIEYLLKKVEKLSTPEPTEEELNSLFMDKQVNPKDIEFDGDKLVSSVEEAASKLKSLNEHNDEYDFSTAKQNPHASKLKSLKDHNDGRRLFDAYGGNSVKSGIACPKCGSELYYNNPDMVLTSNPPKRSVECKNCKHTDYVY
jgi:DNA-directed RNA polymerase subunit M/transcription elongation factor TFIIS